MEEGMELNWVIKSEEMELNWVIKSKLHSQNYSLILATTIFLPDPLQQISAA